MYRAGRLVNKTKDTDEQRDDEATRLGRSQGLLHITHSKDTWKESASGPAESVLVRSKLAVSAKSKILSLRYF